jgi:hypothetical protein
MESERLQQALSTESDTSPRMQLNLLAESLNLSDYFVESAI